VTRLTLQRRATLLPKAKTVPAARAILGFPAQEGQMGICLRRGEFIAALGTAAGAACSAAQQPVNKPENHDPSILNEIEIATEAV
jgi:hypothetical protein